ncbi:hypothetical protein [Paenibacillus spongiae]|uniref:HPP family protein n=1 Tax=Paenibacillus spongiae TaxID=2909671 RepID=A0ABY5SBB0_9BACL|nr:hypothetical protein [Paenibacillus spongiae]UVI30803.1 hypothetical protein L1F29_02690 [Paenibacillus spongiae]
MNMRLWAICCYVAFVYWISLHISPLKMLFYPTLGAFCFLFMSRTDYKGIGKISLGAFGASIIGTIIYTFIPGILALFINTLVNIRLIQKFRLNAPPVLGVSFIPFFAGEGGAAAWHIPLFVGASLAGLTLLLMAVDWLEKTQRAWFTAKRGLPEAE